MCAAPITPPDLPPHPPPGKIAARPWEENRLAEPWIDFVFDCVKRYIHRYGHRMVQSTGTLSGLFISIDEARMLLGGEAAPTRPAPPALRLPPFEETADALARSSAAIDRLAEGDGPIGRIARCFGLDPPTLRILLAAAAPLVSTDISRLFGFAWADFAVKLPSVGFLCELIGGDQLRAAQLQQAFTPDAPLMRYRLIELRDGGAWGTPSPMLHRGVVVPDGVLAHLRDAHAQRETSLPTELLVFGELDNPADALPLDRLFIHPRARRDLEAGVERALRGGRPRLLLTGPAGVGRHTALRAAAAMHGWGVLKVDLGRLAQAPDHFAERLAQAGREALLRQSVLLLDGDTFFEDRAQADKLLPAAAALVGRHLGPVAINAHQPQPSVHRAMGDVFDVVFPLPEPVEQKRVWQRALAEGDPADVELAPQLASRFSISPGTVYASVAEARAHRALTRGPGPLDADGIARSVRHRLDHALSDIAEPFTTTLTWDDVILPDEVRAVLDEIIGQARYREKVYDHWGFRRKMAYGRGLSCLFVGPPGTGKTMVTALIAQTLGRELYRVDLSRVISKWVGETEKNLARVFDEAEKAQVILLFDEADALFGARTEVKGSNDRFANMEINYLLQRMESFDGMSLLTTNFAKSIDEAFKRRLKFRVDFPMPDAEQRTALWRSMLPSTAQVATDIDFNYFGKRYKMSGGNIKNAVLRAAFYAAELDRLIDAELLDRAAMAEAREMGRLI